MTRTRLAVVVLAVVTLAAMVPSALAFWTASGPGATGAEAAALGVPGAVAVDSVDHGSLRISWSAPSGPAPSTYTVRRLGGTEPVTICTGAQLECTDTGLAPETTYQYTVQAALHAWQGPESAAAEGTTGAVPAGPPIVTITHPVVGANDSSSWSSGCSPAGVCGTATVEGGHTIDLVEVSIAGPGGWWDPVAGTFTATEQAWYPATGTDSWTYPMSVPPAGDYTLHTRATDDRALTGTTSRTFSIGTADSPPSLVSLEMRDADADGRVDQVVATFDEPLQTSTDTTAWTLANVPSGGTLESVSTSGSIATLAVTEGTGAKDTAVGSFTVALAASETAIRDAAGNQASFPATAPADKAGPVIVSLADQAGAVKGSTTGMPQASDTLDVTFSEPVSLPGSPVDIPLRWNSNTNSTLAIPGLVDGLIHLGAGYFDKTGNKTGDFTGSTLTRVNGDRTIRVTLGAYSGDATGTGPSGVATVAPAASVIDPAGNAAVGSYSSPAMRFF